jgi:undecaprenyl-diphosphatase
MTRLQTTLLVLREWDLRVCLGFNRTSRVRRVLLFFRAVSWLGNGLVWYVLMLALLLRDMRQAAGPVLHMAGVALVAVLTYKLLKRGTLRPRPYQVHQHIALGAAPLDQFSFPSGHTLHAVAFSLVACAYYPMLVLLLLPFTLLIAASRLVLGLHYPSDVLAGALLGGLIAAGSFRVL